MFKRTVLTALFCGAATLAAAADMPASITVAIVPNYPPMEFKEPATGKLTGFDVELGEALGRKLGIEWKWQETSFDQMLPALTTGRVGLIMSGMTDLASRHEASTFIDYLRSGPAFFIQQSRAAEFTDMAALCGKTVGASRRTSFPKEIAKWSDANCAANPIKVMGTDGSADARTQLKQGRIDAAVQGNETLPYIMGQEPNTYKQLGGAIATQFTGIAVPVKDTDLQQAIAGALDGLIADGTYKSLLVKWQLDENGVEKATINAGQ